METQEKKIVELIPGITSEEIRAIFRQDALREPPYRLYQLNQKGYRYYYRFDAEGKPELFPSVTTILHQVMPMSPFLLDWMLEQGKEQAIEKRDTAAAYGSLMHGQFERLIVNREYDFDAVGEVVAEYLMRENLPEKLFQEWCYELRKDVLAFAQFVKDWNVKPYAIEIGLVHPTQHYAGCIDMPCQLTNPKTGEVFDAIVDFKSGRKGFYEAHELQLFMYRDMWNENYPDKPIERVFNFSPKDWRKEPTYNFKEQTDSKAIDLLPNYLAIAAIKDEQRSREVLVISGQYSLDEGAPADNVLRLEIADLIKLRAEEMKPEAEETELFPQGKAENAQKQG